MRTILETESEFICDIQAPCFQMLQPEEAEVVRASKIQVLFRKDDNLTKQGAFATYVLFIINGFAKQYLERGITVVSAWKANAVPVAEFTAAQIILSLKLLAG